MEISKMKGVCDMWPHPVYLKDSCLCQGVHSGGIL